MGSLDTEPLDVPLLCQRALHYARKGGADEATLGKAPGQQRRTCRRRQGLPAAAPAVLPCSCLPLPAWLFA